MPIECEVFVLGCISSLFIFQSQTIRHVNSNQCLDKPSPTERDTPSISMSYLRVLFVRLCLCQHICICVYVLFCCNGYVNYTILIPLGVCNGSPSQQWILSDLDWKKMSS